MSLVAAKMIRRSDELRIKDVKRLLHALSKDCSFIPVLLHIELDLQIEGVRRVYYHIVIQD
jgi:hypothetical protein